LFLKELHDKYGDTFVIITPPLPLSIMTMDPEDIKHVISTHFDNYVRKTPVDNKISIMLTKLLGEGIFVSDGDVWRHQRTIALPLFTNESLSLMIPSFYDHSKTLFKVLDGAIENNEIIDMQDILKRLTLDTFLEIGYGVHLSTLEAMVPFGTAFDFAQDRITYAIRNPLILLFKDHKFENSIKTVDDFVYQLIEKRQSTPIDILSKNNDLLSRFLCLKDDEGNPYEFKFLRDIVLNFTIAGRDTTGQLMSWVLHLISLNPDVMKKLVEEIDNFNEEISIQSLKSLKYLDNVIHETLRFYPSVPAAARSAKSDDILPSGMVVKKMKG